MNFRRSLVSLAVLFLLLPALAAAENLNTPVSAALMPTQALDPSAVLDVDWHMEDLGNPRTPFENAVASKLTSIGVARTISATYEFPDKAGALYTFEAYQFSRDLVLEAAVRQLKPGVLERVAAASTTMGGFSALAISLSPQGPEVLAVQAGRLLLFFGAPNSVTADLGWFTEKYFEWFASQ